MRVNLVAIGSHGDVLPFIALGVELRTRGFEVTLASAEPFRRLVEQQDLRFESLAAATEYDRIVASPSLWTPIRGARLMTQASMHLLRPTYDFVLGNYEPGTTITVASTLALGARVAQERHRIPLATVHLAPLYIRSHVEPPRMPGLPNFVRRLPTRVQTEIAYGVDQFSLDPLCRPLLAFRAELGLPPLKGVLRWWLHAPECTIAMFPAWFARPQPDWPPQIRQVDFPRAGTFGSGGATDPDLQRFLEGGPKPLVFTFGSAMIHDAAFVRTAFEVCRRSGRRGIVVSPLRHQAPRLHQEQVFQTAYAPFDQLFPLCEAVVHHGGIGTVASGLRAGLPQLVVPLAFDHFDEAIRVERLGVGISISRRRFNARAVSHTLDKLLSSPAVRQRCADWATKARHADGTKDACDAIVKLGRVGQHPGHKLR